MGPYFRGPYSRGYGGVVARATHNVETVEHAACKGLHVATEFLHHATAK